MRRPFAKSLGSLPKLAALFAFVAFGYQAIALPVHAAGHALQNTVQARTGSIEAEKGWEPAARGSALGSDCDLCDLAAHQAASTTTPGPFETFEAVIVRLEPVPTETLVSTSTLLPPARGPPARA